MATSDFLRISNFENMIEKIGMRVGAEGDQSHGAVRGGRAWLDKSRIMLIEKLS
jgi:hypothetical protein